MNTKRILTVFFLLFVMSINANNINVIGEAKITGKNISAGNDDIANYAYIDFSIFWDNSWRTSSAPFNYDAAWVFAKYRIGSGDWKHITLSELENQSEANTTIEGVADGKGVFLYRSNDGTGTFTSNNNKLKWFYVKDGVSDSDDIEVKIFAIEMVYVPQGNYFLGSPTDEVGSFFKGGTTTDPYEVTSENAITVGTAGGNLCYKSNQTDGWGDGNAGDRQGPIPTEFPKGYNAFYLMKYEITQEQYVDFLNMLTRTQQNFHTATDISGTYPKNYRPYVMGKSKSPSFRNGIRVADNFSASGSLTFYCDLNKNNIPNETNDGQTIACNYLSWADAAAYADWAGLRPMTELEYEKAARGANQTPIAWEEAGGVDLFPHDDRFATTIINEGTPDETGGNSNNVTNSWASADLGTMGTGGPMRVGCFAGASSSRTDANVAYYGVMNLSDNVYERVITVGDPEGRSFTGTLGDGTLDANGFHTNTDWPDRYAIGSGMRGADWCSGVHQTSKISSRYNVINDSQIRSGNSGFRACRTK